MTDKDAVVFVGTGLVAFEQTSAVMRRRGVDTHWVGFPFGVARRLRSRLFTTVHNAHDVNGLAEVLRRIGPGRILDLQATEFMLPEVVQAALSLPLRPELAEDLRHRLHWLDKEVAMQGLAAAGVPVPRRSQSTDPQRVVDELGLPVVVKGRIANGGVAVRICHSLDEVGPALAALAEHGGSYAEEFCAGQDGLCYAAAYRSSGEVLLEAAYRGVRSAGEDAEFGELGALDASVTLDDEDLFDVGRRVVAAMGGRGVVNIDAIRTADGLRVIDVNHRPWGSMVALRETGADFVAALLAVLRDEPFTPRRVPGGCRVHTFSTTAINAGVRSPGLGLRQFSVDARAYRRWAGTPYVTAEWARGTTVVARHWLRQGAATGRHLTGRR